MHVSSSRRMEKNENINFTHAIIVALCDVDEYMYCAICVQLPKILYYILYNFQIGISFAKYRSWNK